MIKPGFPTTRAGKVIFWAAAALFVAGIIAGVSLYGINAWYKKSLQPRDALGRDVVVTIANGSGAEEIGDLLQQNDVIRSSKAFQWYVSRNGYRDALQAGTYRLSPAYSVAEIVDILVNGKVDVRSVTFTPGTRLDQIQDILLDEGFSEAEINSAFTKTYKHPVWQYLPPNSSIEGYLYPDTYQINDESTVEDVVLKAFDEFQSNLTQPLLDGIREQGLTVHQAVVLASIVQQEVADFKTQRTVAQVFLKRLAINMPLGADPTFKYAAAVEGVEANPEIDSPYNTRIVTGLPPGPIGNFLIETLEAIANPDKTDYLYFVSGDDGITRFSNTEEEHNKLVEQYCQKLCQQM